MRLPAIAAAIVAVVLIRPVSTQSGDLDVSSLLDRYASGRFEEAINPVKNASEAQARALRSALMSSGRLWIDAAGHSPADRMAIAAAFALETEGLRAERGDWAAPNTAFCAGRCVIEWACALLFERNEIPDAFERDWLNATVMLASGVRDWAFLYTPRAGVEVFTQGMGHVYHALTRFPGDARFRLAGAQAIAARFEQTTEQDEPREGGRLAFPSSSQSNFPTVVVNGQPAGPGAVQQMLSTAAGRRAALRTATMTQFAELAANADVGAEAQTRLAYMRWAGGEYDAAQALAEKVAADTKDPDAKYLALYIAGLAAQSSGTLQRAESLFASALTARPHSQSASIALAALLFQRGDASGAYALSEASFQKRKDDDDPWRLFQYGDYPKLPGMIQTLRRAIVAMGSK